MNPLNHPLKQRLMATLKLGFLTIAAIGVTLLQQPVYASEIKTVPDYPISTHLDYYPTPELKALSAAINRLYQHAKVKKDAYALSMLLLASAQIGDIAAYRVILNSMQQALGQMAEDQTNGSYKAWLMSRVVFAAYSIGDISTQQAMTQYAQRLLKQYASSPEGFSVWALGYLATGNKQQYDKLRNELFSETEALSKIYEQALPHADKLSPARQALRSNALWAWICTLQAAAYANDVNGYQTSLMGIKKLTTQPTIAAALSTGLSHTKHSNDYPAWAISMVRLSAILMHDQQTADTLIKPLQDTLANAKAFNATAEVVLAQANNALAELNASSSLRAHGSK